MSGNGNQVPLAPSQRGPGPYPRAPTPHRAECYLPSAATGAAYMSNTAGGSQASAQTALRVQPTPQPSAPPAPQQDMSKTTMAGHNYVPIQNQTPQARPPYNIPQFRPPHHGTRPSTHPRQQQPYMPNTAATATAPVVYSHLMFHPAHMSIPPSYQQTRPQSYYSPAYMTSYLNYNTPTSHTPSYYFASNSQQLPTPNLQANAAGGRSNPNTLVGPQSTLANPTAPTASLPPQQPHLHQTMTGTRPPHTKRHPHRIPIIDPKTQHDIFSDILSNDSQYIGGDTSERQTPQPDTTPSVAEEFTRMVNEVANQPTESAMKANYVSKNVDLPVSSSSSSIQPQSNAINTNNNSVIKPEILNINENKTLGPDIAVESNETPVVSAISDSPVIVPKMPMNIKQLQKNSDQNVQPLVLDANKNLASNKQHKQNKKPVVPQADENEKFSDNVSNIASHGCPTPVTPASTVATTATVSITPAPVVTQTATSVATATPQPQRIREPRERVKSEEKEKDKNKEKEVQQGKDTPPVSSKSNGSTSSVAISSVDSLTEVINASTSQSSKLASAESAKKQTAPKQSSQNLESKVSCEANIEVLNKCEPVSATSVPTATELLSASIEKLAKDLPGDPDAIAENKEASSAIQAQAKLTQSIASCIRTNQTEAKMKDINLNNKTTADADSANGNATEIKSENVKEDVNKNEKVVKNTKNTNKKSTNKMATNDLNVKDIESHENGKDETDKVNNVEQVKATSKKEEVATKSTPIEKPEVAPQPVFIPKYKYSENQWSPINKSGKKCYDIELLKQIKDDPLSKDKPNIRLLEQCNVIRTTPMQELLSFPTMSRPNNDSLMPTFAKSTGSRNNAPRDAKKDGRNIAPSGKGSVKLTQSPSGSSPHKPVIHVSLSLREDVKLNETENAWKPSRFKKDSLGEEDFKTQDLYKKFRGILNKLTPQKFDTLLDKVKTLEINNQKRLEGVIDLIFEKAIDEPNFSEAYAKMCNKISTLKVPADNATSPDQFVNFRALIISKCQNQFETNKVDEQVLKLEKEISESMDPSKKKELHLLLEEENRRVRMRSVGNVRFIGELYKLKMLTSKIMVYCMTYLIDKLEEEKLECLCKLLTTIGEQVESEVKEQLDNVFKKMQDIVDQRKSNKISSRVRFMIQDVIELRKRKWQFKSVVDSQPKKMDEIQKEAEQQHRNIEILNSIPMGGYRRDEGGRGKRGEGRRQNSNSFMDSSWKSPRPNYTVDTSKLKAVTQKNINTIKLAPQNSGWNHGSGMKNTTQTSSNTGANLTNNMYSVLDTVPAVPTSLKGSKDVTPNYSKGASIERSTFASRSDFSSGTGSRSGSMGVARSNSSSRGTSAAPPTPAAPNNEPTPPPAPVPQKPLTEKEQKSVKSIIDLYLINPDDNEFVADIKQSFQPQYHAAVINEILNVAIEKSAKEIGTISKILLLLVSTNTISAENFVLGISETFTNAPDLYIDIPMLNEYLAKIITPQIEKKHVTFAQLVKLCENNIISSKQGPLFLEAVIRDLKNSMGPSFVKSKWQESGVQLKDWMSEDKVSKWIEDNKFEFLEGNAKVAGEEVKKILTPAETQSKLLQLMNSDENYDCIKGWVQDNLGKSSNEDWFMRALIQAICEHALFGSEGRDVPHFSRDRMNKYSGLINDFGETRQAREASCLFGIQQLIHRLEHPQGLTLEIFQNLHEQYIINAEGFIAWEESEMEPEGKGVMMKALTSFFTNIKEVDNDDSCSED